MKAGETVAPAPSRIFVAAAFLCVSFVAPALAARLEPPRRNAIFSPPALITLTGSPLGEPRAPLAPPFAADVTTAVAWFDARPRRSLETSDLDDFAWSLLDDNGRDAALTIADWVGQKTGLSNERRGLRAALAAGYAARGFKPFWIENGQWRAAVAPVLARIANAGDDALDLSAYRVPTTDRTPPTARDELAVSEAVAAYALQARGSRIEPERLAGLIGAVTTLPDPAQAVSEVAAAGTRAGDALQAFNPPHYGYQQLREKLIEMRAQRAAASSPGHLVADASGDATSDIAGMTPSRRKGRHAAPPAAPPISPVEAEIIANMERWRWLPRDLGDPRIEVNIPDFELAVIRDNQVAHRTRVIVGKVTTPTPIFSDEMEEIIVNPSWYVPKSIIEKEWGGSVGNGYQVSYRRGQMVVRQPPGERNALGRVKFVFPNDFAVYMHDTPQRGLFANSYRAFSHGCMRVFEPFALAEAVLGPRSGWTEEKVRKLVGRSERYITLDQKLPVHIEYFTAYVDEAGGLVQRPDLYGYSARVRRALGLGG